MCVSVCVFCGVCTCKCVFTHACVCVHTRVNVGASVVWLCAHDTGTCTCVCPCMCVCMCVMCPRVCCRDLCFPPLPVRLQPSWRKCVSVLLTHLPTGGQWVRCPQRGLWLERPRRAAVWGGGGCSLNVRPFLRSLRMVLGSPALPKVPPQASQRVSLASHAYAWVPTWGWGHWVARAHVSDLRRHGQPVPRWGLQQHPHL